MRLALKVLMWYYFETKCWYKKVSFFSSVIVSIVIFMFLYSPLCCFALQQSMYCLILNNYTLISSNDMLSFIRCIYVQSLQIKFTNQNYSWIIWNQRNSSNLISMVLGNCNNLFTLIPMSNPKFDISNRFLAVGYHPKLSLTVKRI